MNDTKTVVIVGAAHDLQCQYVGAAIADRGGQPLLLETAKIPESAALTWRDDEIWYEGQPLQEHRCFYLKALHLSLPSHDPQQFSQRNFSIWQEQYAAERERHSLLASVLRELHADGRCFVNPVESFDLHFLKRYQIARLKRHGVPVPATLATTEPAALQAFAEQHGSVIYKPLSGGASVKRIEPADLEPERLALLRNAPVLFQQEIKGEEYRAYVLNGEPVAALSIPTEGLVDARVALDRATLSELPQDAWEHVINAADAVGVVFGAVDLRRTDEGEWFVFECNPTPAISFFDTEDGLIVGRLADYLLEHA